MECRGCHGIGHAERQIPTAHPELKGNGKGKGKDDGYGKGKGEGDEGKGWQGKGSWGKGKGNTGKSSTYSFNASPALSFLWGNPSGGGWGAGWETWGGDNNNYNNNGGYTRQLGSLTHANPFAPIVDSDGDDDGSRTTTTTTTSAAASTPVPSGVTPSVGDGGPLNSNYRYDELDCGHFRAGIAPVAV